MGRRSFEMFQYRQVLVRLRQGDTDRDIARTKVMGRGKVAVLRALASERGWLAAQGELPDDATIAAALGQTRRARSTISSAEPHRAQIQRWFERRRVDRKDQTQWRMERTNSLSVQCICGRHGRELGADARASVDDLHQEHCA